MDEKLLAVCYWVEDDEGIYQTSCQETFYFETGTVLENGFNYCPYCGCELQEGHPSEDKVK